MDRVLDAIIDEHKAKREAMATMDSDELKDEDLLDVLLRYDKSSSALTHDHIKNLILELEKKRKERAQAVYEQKKQLTKLRVKAEKLAEEKLGSQLDIIAPVKYYEG